MSPRCTRMLCASGILLYPYACWRVPLHPHRYMSKVGSGTLYEQRCSMYSILAIWRILISLNKQHSPAHTLECKSMQGSDRHTYLLTVRQDVSCNPNPSAPGQMPAHPPAPLHKHYQGAIGAPCEQYCAMCFLLVPGAFRISMNTLLEHHASPRLAMWRSITSHQTTPTLLPPYCT